MTGPAKLSSLVPADWISLHARYSPDDRCLVTGDGTTWTFGEINRRVNRLARALQQRGVRRRDRIGVLATDSVDYMVLLMASLKIGSTYVPFNYRLAESEIVTFARAAKLDAFVTMARYADTTAAVLDACPGLRLVASFDDADGLPRVDELIATEDDSSDLVVPTEPEDVVSIGTAARSGDSG